MDDDDRGRWAEIDWASFFSKFSIPFEYEPHFFRFNGDYGFRPDFFFPLSNAYIEVTITRHPHRKNRKIRKARKRYPHKAFLLLTRHEHNLVFGDNPFPLDPQRTEPWRQVVSNMDVLLDILKGLPRVELAA